MRAPSKPKCVCINHLHATTHHHHHHHQHQILEEQQALLFRLQQQRLIEMVRSGDAAAALEFAREYLAPVGEERPELLDELGARFMCVCVCVWTVLFLGVHCMHALRGLGVDWHLAHT